MFRTLTPGDSISVALIKLLQGGRRGESGYIQVGNRGNRLSEQSRSDIQLRNLAFYLWEDISLWAHCIHSFLIQLGHLGPILFPSSPCFLHSPSSSAITMGWQHSLDRSLGGPHSHLEARNSWWLWHFLFINMAGDINLAVVHRLDSKKIPKQIQVRWITIWLVFCITISHQWSF